MSNNLTGNKVSQTYQRLVQYVSGDYYDGLGNELPIRKYWGSFYDTTIQTNAGATYANIMTFDSVDFSSGITIENGSEITCEFAGIYNIQFSAQLDKTDSGNDDVEIWLMKNGNNLDDTATVITLSGNNAKAVAAWNFFVDAAAGDYYQLAWHSNDLDLRILSRAAQTNPLRPAIPSIILTINKVS
jgi:hypothetical protein